MESISKKTELHPRKVRKILDTTWTQPFDGPSFEPELIACTTTALSGLRHLETRYARRIKKILAIYENGQDAVFYG